MLTERNFITSGLNIGLMKQDVTSDSDNRAYIVG